MSREKTLLNFQPGFTIIVEEDWYGGGAAAWFDPQRVVYKGKTGSVMQVTKGNLVHVLFSDNTNKTFPPSNLRVLPNS